MRKEYTQQTHIYNNIIIREHEHARTQERVYARTHIYIFIQCAYYNKTNVMLSETRNASNFHI